MPRDHVVHLVDAACLALGLSASFVVAEESGPAELTAADLHFAESSPSRVTKPEAVPTADLPDSAGFVFGCWLDADLETGRGGRDSRSSGNVAVENRVGRGSNAGLILDRCYRGVSSEGSMPVNSWSLLGCTVCLVDTLTGWRRSRVYAREGGVMYSLRVHQSLPSRTFCATTLLNRLFRRTGA